MDPVVYYKPKEASSPKEWKVLMVQMKNSKDYAFPGGMKEAIGEDGISRGMSELIEEAGKNFTPEQKAELSKHIKAGRVVYDGYMPDDRAGENAWMASEVIFVEIPEALATSLRPAGDNFETARAGFFTVDFLTQKDLPVRAGHKSLLRHFMCDR